MTSVLRRLGRRIKDDLFVAPNDQFAALNGMRGLSAYLVACFHVAIYSGHFPLMQSQKTDLNWFHWSINGFWVGLDVFFVLSGFLIGRILMNSQKRTGTVEFWSFFTRRSMRIFPAYYLVLTLAIFWYMRSDVGLTFWFTAGHPWTDLLRNSWQNYTYTLNYFFRAGEPNAMSWAWSLCVEEHFYLLLPLVLVMIHRFDHRGVRAGLLWGWMLLPVLIRLVQYLLNPDIVLLEGFYYRSHNRFDEVIYGVLVAYYYVHHHDAFERLVKRLGSWTWVIGLLLVGAVWGFGGLQNRGFFAVVVQFNLMALGAAFLMVNGIFLDNRATRFFAHWSWYPISRVSYGIFLTHTYVLFIIMKQGGLRNAGDLGSFDFFMLFLSVMLGTTLVSMVMFVAIEQPLIELGARVSRRFRQPLLSPPVAGAVSGAGTSADGKAVPASGAAAGETTA